MFHMLKEFTSKWALRADAINDENGVTLTEYEDINYRWKEYSTTLYDSTTSRLITGVGNRMNHYHPSRKWKRLATDTQFENGSDDIPAEFCMEGIRRRRY